MKFRNLLIAGVLATATLAFAPARAAPVVGHIPGGSAANDFINTFFAPGTRIEGWYAANVYLIGGPASITVEYFGAEAGFVNHFYFGSNIPLFTHNGGTTFNDNGSDGLNGGDALGSVNLGPQLSGLLNFLFTVDGGALGPVNGANPDNLGPLANFFISFDDNYALDTNVNGVTRGSGQSFFLFLDDGGAGNDDNHDDMVLRISITGARVSIPEPASLAMLGLGLFALGALRRRRQS